MSTEMSKPTHEKPGLVAFLLLRASPGVADVSASRAVIMVKPSICNVQGKYVGLYENGEKIGVIVLLWSFSVRFCYGNVAWTTNK